MNKLFRQFKKKQLFSKNLKLFIMVKVKIKNNIEDILLISKQRSVIFNKVTVVKIYTSIKDKLKA